MSRKFRDMESPEAAYLREQAAASARQSRQAAAEEYDEGVRDDNAVWAIGREGRRGYDPQAAAAHAVSRDQHFDRAARHEADAERQEANARQPQQKKRWWQA
ncbi:hypothetical protein V2S66_04415 [Streptomyces sp. V4-01]|uniref:Uncharacterized protein n=1 Tax=Actinacidiphila polyblastidii TaxID=3110430 RepID=A0ABU7P5Y2_9ACTN|nr:hypothetical protein [Streptomyces sp. V4-01]